MSIWAVLLRKVQTKGRELVKMPPYPGRHVTAVVIDTSASYHRTGVTDSG